jgi:thiol-disulfide isomerase/thioredoxin
MQLLRALGMFGVLVTLRVWAAEPVWQTTSGERIQGRLSAVYGKYVVFARRDGATMSTINTLDDAALERVAEFLTAQPKQRPLWKDSKSAVARALDRRLEILNGDKLARFDPATRTEPEFYLVYFGANWCPPCRAFSPDFVKEYQRLQTLAPGRFEAVFVSSDRDSSEQLEYVRHVSMPWPVLRFSSIGSADAIERWKGPGIPCLVVVTPDGDAIMHSYHGAEYVGPHQVLKEFEALLRAMADENETKRATHRLAVIRQVRDAAGKSTPAKPYLVSMDLRRYRTLAVSEIMATLSIDAQGHVVDASFEPELPTALKFQIETDANSWLFLPAVKDGQAQPVKVKLPLNIGTASAAVRK